LLGHCRALEVVGPGGREFLDRGKAGISWLNETRGRNYNYQELLALSDRIKRDFRFTSLYLRVRAS
jgi:hypothetical protein